MTPQARVRHALAERTRITVDAMRYQRAYFARVCEELSAMPEVAAVRINPDSASLVVQHVAGGLATVAAQARERQLFALDTLEPRTPLLVQRTEAGVDVLEGALSPAAAGGIGPAALGYAALAATVVLQISRGQRLMPAATLAWSAFRLWGRARTATQ